MTTSFPGRIRVVLPTVLLLLVLSACGAMPGGDDIGSNTSGDALASDESSSLDCDESSLVDEIVCDDLNEALDEDPAPPCELADGSSVWTPAFANFNPDRPVRCAVVDEAGLFAALVGYGAQIDGVGDVGAEGTADHNIFYVVRGACHGEPTYWPATATWSQYKGTSPSLTDQRFGNAQEAVDAICS